MKSGHLAIGVWVLLLGKVTRSRRRAHKDGPVGWGGPRLGPVAVCRLGR